MEIYSVSISWIDNAGKDRSSRFVCPKTQVIQQINGALTRDVGPTFSDSCNISVQSLGEYRG